MNVVHFVEGLDRSEGGPSRSVPRLCSGLASAGFAVTLLHTRQPHRYSTETDEAVVSGVRLLRTDDSGAAAAVDNADIVHLHGIWSVPGHAIAKEAARRGTPIVVSPRGMLEPWARRHHRLRKTVAWHLFQHRDLKRAAFIHATSEDEARHLSDIGFSNSVIVPNGVDVPDQVAQLSGAPTILFLSRIHPKKGLPLLVEAATRLRSELSAGGWRIVIAGPDEGGHQHDVQNAIERAGIDGLFEFVGEIDGEAKKDSFLAAHVFVLPSHSENFGLVVAEALSFGVPVITTTATPWRVLEESACGWHVEPTAAALTAALRSAVSLPAGARRDMGARGRKLVAASYSWDSVAARLGDAYEHIGVEKVRR